MGHHLSSLLVLIYDAKSQMNDEPSIPPIANATMTRTSAAAMPTPVSPSALI